MYTYVHVVYVYSTGSLQAIMEARGDIQRKTFVSSSITFCLIPLRVSQWTRKWPFLVRLVSQRTSWNLSSLYLCLSTLRLQAMVTMITITTVMANFSHGARDLNSSPHGDIQAYYPLFSRDDCFYCLENTWLSFIMVNIQVMLASFSTRQLTGDNADVYFWQVLSQLDSPSWI